MKQLIIATGNSHKTEEFAQLLAGSGFEVQSVKAFGGMPHVVEDGETFAANAQLKAEALKKIVPQDAWVLADDSGLAVDALDGAPGIYSARYAGRSASDVDNVRKLLDALDGAENAERSARFICVLCLIGPDGEVQSFEGRCEGHIADQSSGKSGFGYDPVFVPEGYSESFAELGDSLKAKLSHRSHAVSELLAAIIS